MKKKYRKRAKKSLSFLKWKLKSSQRKVFCIGRNKTGTTSLTAILEQERFYVANQTKSELLIKYYREENWQPIIDFCKSAEAFQDAPFSWPGTWKHVAKHFPNALYILTYRDSEQWYDSICRFHTNLFSSDKSSTPTESDLRNATYRYTGFMWDANRAVWNTPVDDLYNKEIMISNYEKHNREVEEYFKGKQNFLKINVSDSSDFVKLKMFLGLSDAITGFPKLNSSK